MVLLKKYLVAFTFLSLLLLQNCSKKSDISSNDLEQQLEGSSWAIHLYSENGIDLTNDFSGCVFSFQNDKSCTIKKGSTTYTGSWQVIKGDNASEKLRLDLSSNATLQKLNELWKLEGISYNLAEFSTDDPSKNKQFHFIRL